MLKIRLLFLTIFFFISCNDEQNQQTDATDLSAAYDFSKLPKKVATNAKANAILNNWEAYGIFEASVDAVYKAENREDLLLTIDNIIEKQKELEASDYPETFDQPQVRSRQKVFKTYLLKVKASLEDRTDVLPPAKEMIQAYNAYRNQFNVAVNSALDINLILDDE